MAIVKQMLVRGLRLDPNNYRHMPQRTEERALHAMSELDAPYFWGLARRILENGYVESENIIVLKTGTTDENALVKEGNRRVAILKLALKELKGKDLDIPDDVRTMLNGLTPEWKAKNSTVPCFVFEASEKEQAEQVVDVTHGKAEYAGRLDWNAVARARHHRERNLMSEPALDLLEKYIKHGTNLSQEEKDRWAADYPLSILLNAINLIHPRLDFESNRDLVEAYPKIAKHRAGLDNIIRDIGRGHIKTYDVRDSNFAVDPYDIPLKTPQAAPPATQGTASSTATQSTSSANPGTTTTTLSVNVSPSPTRKVKAAANNTQVSVRRLLRKLEPRGANRDKIVTLINEAVTLDLQRHPHAFCFVMRTIIELSAKAYCEDHKASGGPSATRPDGNDRNLVDVLRDIFDHLTKNKSDKPMVKRITGSMSEFATPHGLFSITSMNQLIHSSSFSITEKHISVVFSNIYPMLEEMNR